jgi:hypothetical protein
VSESYNRLVYELVTHALDAPSSDVWEYTKDRCLELESPTEIIGLLAVMSALTAGLASALGRSRGEDGYAIIQSLAQESMYKDPGT